jgi:hypothetical protein
MNTDQVDTSLIEPEQDAEIDFFRPEDGPGVAALFRAVYGDDYPVKYYYDPRALAEENASSRTISSVARTVKGDIVGHTALFATAPYRRLYESGAGLVLPAYRFNGHIFTRLIAHSFESGPQRFPIDAIFGDAILNHPYTQKVTRRHRFGPSGLQVDLMPGEVYAKEGGSGGRVASLLMINVYQAFGKRGYVPAAYEEQARFLFDLVSQGQDLIASSLPIPRGQASRINLQYFDFARVARFSIEEIGDDFQTVLGAMEKSAADRGAVIFQTWISMAIPWLGLAVDWLRDDGYFLCGVLPRWFDNDAFIMQKMNHRPNWEGIVMVLELGEAVLRLVRQDWENR